MTIPLPPAPVALARRGNTNPGLGDASLTTHRFTAFGGAVCSIHAAGERHREVSAAVAEVYAFEARLTRFEPASELCRFNAAAGHGRVEVSPLLAALLEAALWAFHRSGGLVNAATLAALRAAGYDRTIDEVRARAAPWPTMPPPVPPLDTVLRLGEGWAELTAGSSVDLGGIGKGWLADRLCEQLDDAVVNLGGDLRAIGAGPFGQGWRVGIGDCVLLLRDAGVATSGIQSRRWRNGHHLIDPRTGLPASAALTAVSVVAADALLAEVLAKGALLTGADGAAWARRHGAVRVVVGSACE